MKAAIYRVEGRTHEDNLTAMARGLREHGVEAAFFRDNPAHDADFAVVWGERIRIRMADRFKKPILVMERGYLGDRFKYTSLGWDGLNGRAEWPKIDDRSRWDTNFSDLIHDWRRNDGYALIMGQVPGDAALNGVSIGGWYTDVACKLHGLGWDVRFREHPLQVQRGAARSDVPHAPTIEGSLVDALNSAGLVVTYNSTSGVNAMLYGCPVHAEDCGSMVYPLASHDLKINMPYRLKHFHRMAWMQWSMNEIKSGAAWDVVRHVRGF